MKQLTQEQLCKIADSCGLTEFDQVAEAMANAAYELGIAEGKAVGAAEMRERCDNAIQCLLLDPYKENTAADALAAIRALKETP